ncbi:unnamed protein product [Closterium sp. NIES-54]
MQHRRCQFRWWRSEGSTREGGGVDFGAEEAAGEDTASASHLCVCNPCPYHPCVTLPGTLSFGADRAGARSTQHRRCCWWGSEGSTRESSGVDVGAEKAAGEDPASGGGAGDFFVAS